MSYTGVYTETQPLQYENDADYVVIQDPAQLKNSLKGVLADAMETLEVRQGDYPETVYKAFKGFKQYEDHPSGFYNVERLAAEYDSEEYADFWAKLSKYMYPFYFLHSPKPNNFYNLLDALTSVNNAYLYLSVSYGNELWTWEMGPSILGFNEDLSTGVEENEEFIRQVLELEGWNTPAHPTD